VSRILNKLKDDLLEWEGVYNTVRPHQALNYMTPPKFLGESKECYERVQKIDRSSELCYKLIKSGYEDDGAVVAKNLLSVW